MSNEIVKAVKAHVESGREDDYGWYNYLLPLDREMAISMATNVPESHDDIDSLKMKMLTEQKQRFHECMLSSRAF